MNRYATLGLLLALVTACPADPEPNDTQGVTTTAPADSTTLDCGSGGCCDVNPNYCGPTESATSTGPTPADSTTSAGSTSASSTGSDTGSGVEPPCGFDATLSMLAMGKTDPTDCGTVTLDDDVAAWQAASDCAAAAAAAQEGFQAAFQLPSDDSLIFDGYYGVVGFVYGLGNVYTDTFGDPMLQSRSCTDVTTLDGCMVDVGVHCLACLGAGEVVPLECTM